MEEAMFIGKKVPWSDLEVYLKLHQESIEPCILLKKSNSMALSMIESSLA